MSLTPPNSPYQVPPLGDDLAVIEAESGFWTSSPELMLICATAHARGVGRWALLGAVLANLLSWLPPYVMLTDKDGRTDSTDIGGSLNFFVHLIDDSGEGKTRVMNAAKVLVPPNVDRYGTDTTTLKPDLCPSGTGEGLLKHFVSMETVRDDVTNESRDVVMQRTDVGMPQIDEVSTYIGELSRTGSKTAGIVTSLWSGQLTGSNTSGKDSRTRVPAHAARVVTVMLAQPELCGALFTDELIAGGTPQRPVWLPASDWTPCPVQIAPQGVTLTPPRDCWKYLPPAMHPQAVVAPPPPAPGTLPQVGGSAHNPPVTAPSPTPINTLPPELRFPAPASQPVHAVWIHQPPAARAAIVAADAERARTKLSPAQKAALTPAQRNARKAAVIQNHALLTGLKVTVGLGLLHRRHGLQPTDEDWRLAGVVMRVNLGMLSYLWCETRAVRRAQSIERGTDRGVEKAASDAAESEEHAVMVEEMAGVLWRKLAREVGPRDANTHRRWFDNGRRKHLKEVREFGVETGLWEKDGNLYYALDPSTGQRVQLPLLGPGMEAMLSQMQANQAQNVQTQNGTQQ